MSDVRIVPRDRRDSLGEGPLWSARGGALYWVDILGARLNRLRLADDRVDSWDLPEMTGWVIEHAGTSGFIAGLRSGFHRLSLDPLTLTPLARLDTEPPGNRMNDAKADAAGRIWAGTMPMGGDVAAGCLYRLDPDGSLNRVDTGYHIANGPAISRDGGTLFHTDSRLSTIYRFAVAADGTLGDRAAYLTFTPEMGTPDGMTIDADDHLWVACWGAGQLLRFTPDGAIERAVALPASQITSCAFAGPGLDRLFVTSAADGVDEPCGGALFELAPGVRGLAPHPYRGAVA